MPDYDDVNHRPHSRYNGESPRNPIMYGPESISVRLTAWGPQENLFANMWNELQANWGESPERVMNDEDLTDAQMKYVESCFAGKTLPQVLEGISFWFEIDGITRACTHQLVRTRIGAAMMQHGGRDNDWRHRNWTLPETIRRATEEFDSGSITTWGRVTPGFSPESCVTNRDALSAFVSKTNEPSLYRALSDTLQRCRDTYAALVDAGVPWQDARRFLPIGMQTYIHINYNYLAMRDVMANRLEHVMDWEINCVAQLMKREVVMKCPSVFSQYLGSHSDRQGRAAFAKMKSWPPDGKYPAEYVPSEHEHTRQQMPYWVLHPDSMAGGPVQWVPTNGVYPAELLVEEKKP